MPKEVKSRRIEPRHQFRILQPAQQIVVVRDRIAQPVDIGIRVRDRSAEVILDRVILIGCFDMCDECGAEQAPRQTARGRDRARRAATELQG